jgi:hypothetical protein
MIHTLNSWYSDFWRYISLIELKCQQYELLKVMNEDSYQYLSSFSCAIWVSEIGVLLFEYCELKPNSQNLGVQEMSQRHPLLHNVKCQSLMCTCTTVEELLVAVFSCQSMTKRYTESLWADRCVPIIRAQNLATCMWHQVRDVRTWLGVIVNYINKCELCNYL